MNPEIKAQWIAALRSGEYRQGRNTLRDAKDRFCCLGVLCDLAEKAGVISEPQQMSTGIYQYADGFSGRFRQIGVLPEKVAEWSGLDDDMHADPYDPEVERDGVRRCLSALNDEGWEPDPATSTPLTFDQIADLIEEQL